MSKLASRAPATASKAAHESLKFRPFERALAIAAFLCLAIGMLVGQQASGGLLIVVLGLLIATDFGFANWPDGVTRLMMDAALGVTTVLLAVGIFISLSSEPGLSGVSAWAFGGALWLCAWLLIERLSSAYPKPGLFVRIAIPAIFGLTLLALWEIVTRAGDVSAVLLPPPSMIAVRFAGSLDILWADFVQTVFKAVLAGYIMGCGAGFLTALAVDRSDFLKRGLLPIGNLVSALPIIGVAPIMVMWFGFDWQSKAAVVVIMTFFPMLVNTVAGLNAAAREQKDLMRTYAASYWQTLLKLRLPAAAPFIFNALKINSTLALIGAIVAEFFGTPIVGMGFRISTEVGRMNLDMAWAEITVAALAGVAFYGLVSAIERAVTFWHPSMRK